MCVGNISYWFLTSLNETKNIIVNIFFIVLHTYTQI